MIKFGLKAKNKYDYIRSIQTTKKTTILQVVKYITANYGGGQVVAKPLNIKQMKQNKGF